MRQLKIISFETGTEILKAIRAPEFILPTLVFPVIFYLIFGVMLSNGAQARYLLATYGVFAVMGPAIFGFGIAVSQDRAIGWLSLKRAVPAPLYVYILAKVIVTILFSALAVILVYLVSGFMGGVILERHIWALLFLTHILACIPFILLGILIGLLFQTNAAIAVANLLFLGFALLGGLWLPVTLFPEFMQVIATWFPSYHLGEIALGVVGEGAPDFGGHLTVIIIMTAVLSFAVAFAWRRGYN